MTKKLVLIVDHDGGVANNAHRVHLFKANLWDDYEEAAKDDSVHPIMAAFLNSVYWSTFELVVTSVRYEKYRKEMYEWYQRHNIFPEHILLRENLDIPKTKEPELKLKFLEGIKRLYPEEEFDYLAIEDRDDCVEAYRNAGIECWQVRNGQLG